MGELDWIQPDEEDGRGQVRVWQSGMKAGEAGAERGAEHSRSAWF